MAKKPQDPKSLLFLSAIAVLFPAVALSAPGNSTSSAIPDDVRSLLSPSDTVLAYKAMNALGDGGPGAVMVVRHALSNDAARNPCDLIVLQRKDATYVVSDKSDKAVDCLTISFPKRAGEMDLNDNLTVEPKEITYFNERERGGQTYTFSYSSEKSAWHLTHASSVSTQPGKAKVDVIELTVDYPSNIGWIPMSSFNPRAIADAMAKHRAVH